MPDDGVLLRLTWVWFDRAGYDVPYFPMVAEFMVSMACPQDVDGMIPPDRKVVRIRSLGTPNPVKMAQFKTQPIRSLLNDGSRRQAADAGMM